MVTRGGGTVTGVVTVTVAVVVVVAALVGAAEGMDRGPAARENRMKNLKSSNEDLKALREKYKSRIDIDCKGYGPSPSDPPLPTVPESFMTQVEYAFLEDDLFRVIHGVEMYDSSSRRGVNDYDLSAGVGANSSTYLVREAMHYNHYIDEALFIREEDPCIVTGEEDCTAKKECQAGKIDDLRAEIQELFGNVDTNSGAEFLGASGILQFGPEFNYTYMGTQACRGLSCKVFQTCMTKPHENTSLLYTYYWSDTDWDVQNNGDQVPIMVDIVGDNIIRHIAFFDFRRDWMPALDELEPPVDVYCHNRVSYISQPSIVSRFFYRSERVGGVDITVPIGDNETLQDHARIVFPQQEWYDWDRRISRTDYMPFFLFNAERRFENLTQDIMEFNQGLNYKVLPRLGTCKIAPINYNVTWGDVEVGPDGSIHMMSPWNFEDLAEPMQYNGLHWERGMQADVWVGVKLNPTIKMNETIVWYFASPFFTADIQGRDGRDNPQLPTLDKVPIKLERYLNRAEGIPHLVYHIYSYESLIPLTHNHDISICYDPSQMRHFIFDLPPYALNNSRYLRENLKYAIQGSLQEAGNLSPLRINRLELNQTDKAVTVLFTLLEKPSRIADVSGDENENYLDDAVNAIRSTIDDSQLIIQVEYGNSVDNGRKVTFPPMTARPGTMKEVNRGSGQPQPNEVLTGFSSGDMAGLAVGMIILGCLLGFGGMYGYVVYSKK